MKLAVVTHGKFKQLIKQHHKKKKSLMKKNHTFSGVMGVWFEKEQGKLTVEGEGVDILAFAQTLKKKLGSAEIIEVYLSNNFKWI